LANPEWNDFKIVLALGRGGSFAAAARLLGVDDSTISRRLAAVEDALAVRLIVRGGREFSFTAEGRTVLASAEAMENAVATAVSNIRSSRTELDGVVRISCIPTMLRLLLPFQAAVADKHPKLSVQLDSSVRMVNLGTAEADIAIRMRKPTEPDVIAAHPFKWGSTIYASRDYLQKHGHPSCYEDLRAHKLVQYDRVMLHLPQYNWLEKYAPPNAPSMRVENAEVAFGVIVQGGGIGIISCFYGQYSPELVRVFPEDVLSTTAWIVYHETLRHSARCRAVVELLAAYLDQRKHTFCDRLDAS
jgi:DNA-binding transcriptional LysR family regulator